MNCIFKVSSACIDGTPAMLKNKPEFSSQMKLEIPHLQGTPCFVHHHALV